MIGADYAKPLRSRGFTSPPTQEAVNFSQRPLIALDDGTYVLLNRSWCAPAFYEALAIHARTTLGDGVETQIGLAFERLVRTLLSELGVPVVSGKYKVDKQDGECDVVVDTPDTWIFIETKKKALTRPSRGAKTVNIVTDLAKSMIDMQAQLGQHEVLLRQQGSLLLTDGDQAHEVVLAGKGVERVAIALLDYGSFQDRVVIQGMLEGLAGRELLARDPADQKELSKLTPKLAKLATQYEALLELGAIVEHNPFFHCWFISLGQLLVMLDHVQDAGTFKAEIFRARHVSFGSLDLYFEYKHARSIRP